MPYAKKYLESLPSTGIECPNKCGGTIETGKYEGSMICRTCGTAYYKSKFPPKSEGEKKVQATGMAILHDDMMEKFKELNERLDALADYLVRKLGK